MLFVVLCYVVLLVVMCCSALCVHFASLLYNVCRVGDCCVLLVVCGMLFVVDCRLSFVVSRV